MLEYFVHLDADDPPRDLVLATAEVPDDVLPEHIEVKDLPSNWRESPAPPSLTHFGDEFVKRAEHVALIVPSALAPRENNWLLNPAHADFRRIVVETVEPLNYDPRMFDRKLRSRKHK